ncbi:penicillin-binding protein, 1A family [Gemmatirosa kalamazoonensis]|uniref:Penicillin-binding protein, 1A family n=2 Tax=Gemmatirosa kalamazoonensis TaxID=861299 RepID=W0RL17_9BACT|nr:penicillin-binding protein, 1A family [Gemmatirosa kalamazoonensis]
MTFLAAGAAGGLYASWALACRGGTCPSADALEGYAPAQTSKLFSADGRFLAEIGNERRTLIKLEDIPPVVRQAFLTVEDKRFYRHGGIDWLRIPGALARDIVSRSWKEGFSTITMQLARNIFTEDLTREKTPVRKLREAKVARAIEARYPKNRILELYLNQIYLGSGAYGVETAAQRYFGKSVRDLNLAEAATLAALPKGPNRYDPRRYPERSVQRRNTIIELMRKNGVVSDADASLAKAYPLQLASKTESGEIAPYYVEWIRQQLEAKFGKQLYSDGLKVYTTLDLDMQSAAERALERQLRNIEAGRYGPFAHTTYEQYVARGQEDPEASRAAPNSPYLQGAFIAIDPRTGAVRALVGGRDFDDSKFNRAVQAQRQPGSTFKPIVYATAVQNGRPPSYIVDDSPVSIDNMGGQTWTPENYDRKFLGPMPMRKGLYTSRNIIAIKTGMELGESAVIDEARKFGITTPIPPYPSIFIGSADVYPLELISAYSTFATLGTRAVPFAIARVENQRGDVLWQPEPQRMQIMSPEESYLMVSMMKDVNVRGTAAGAVAGAGFDIPSAGKTGTTNDGTNVWYVGYTSDLVAGVWMGLDKPQKIKNNAQGGELAAPAWTAFMTEVYRRKPAPPDWPVPPGIVERQLVANTNVLYDPAACPGAPVSTDIFIAGTEPVETCATMPYPGSGLPGDTLGGVTPDTGAYPAPRPLPNAPPRAEPGPVPRPTVPAPDSAVVRRPAPSFPGADSARRPRADSARRAATDSLRRPRPDTIPR